MKPIGIIEHLKRKLIGFIEILFIEPKQITSEDRHILERTILPFFGEQERYQRILFVGCSAYTQWYDQFFSMKEYWTIDYKDIKQSYGANRHVVDSIVHLGRHFDNDYFDLIIMNGVIGFGLDHPRDIETALEACFLGLKAQGVLVLGWNDDRQRMPIDLAAIQALKKFREYRFPPLQTCHVRTEGRHRHVFSFYRKIP